MHVHIRILVNVMQQDALHLAKRTQEMARYAYELKGYFHQASQKHTHFPGTCTTLKMITQQVTYI